MYLADEGLNYRFIKALRAEGLRVDWVKDLRPGISDFQVIEHARKKYAFLITEDKDFGEWIFAHHIKGISVILLRYQKQDETKILHHLRNALTTDEYSSSDQFITITRDKIRKRPI